MNDLVQRIDQARRVEGAPTADCLVQNATEGEDIGARIGRFAQRLLRRHVTDRAEDSAGCGGPGHCGARGIGRTDGLDLEFSKAEIEHLRIPRMGDHDVFRFEIAVDDSGAVSSSNGIRDLRHEIERSPERQSLG